MKKKIISIILISILAITVLSGCGNSAQKNTEAEAPTRKVTTETDVKEADTYYEMGRTCLYGLDGQEVNPEAAYDNFEKALEQGMTEANFYLGVLYDWYGYPEKNYEKARAYYEAVGDDPYAQLSLGFLYYDGRGVEKDTEKGQELFDAVIAKDCVEGYLASGIIARNEGDYDAALEYFNKSLEGKEQIYIAHAMYNIGFMHRYGKSVERDFYQAIEWYEKAANLGHSDAMYKIGCMYHYGEINVKPDFYQALEWYEKAADLGHSDAMNNIGRMYAFGDGVKQDYSQAMEWYKKAADLGNIAAIINIGDMYAFGNGVEQDYSQAMEWYEKAADLGDSGAMYAIGNMYLGGYGVEKSFAKAEEWFERAKAAKE